MGFHDLDEILLMLLFGEDRGGGRQSPHGRGAGPLGARIHVAFVVITDIDEVRPPLRGPAQGLDAHVEGPAVAGNSHDGGVRPVQGRRPATIPEAEAAVLAKVLFRQGTITGVMG